MGLFDLFKKKDVDDLGNPFNASKENINYKKETEPEQYINTRAVNHPSSKYSVVLINTGSRVIEVFSTLVRMIGISSLTFRNITDLTEKTPLIVGSYVNREDAEELKKALTEAGAEAEVQYEDKHGNYKIALKEIGINKIQVIAVVKQRTGLGLKETKELVENYPVIVKEGLSESDAEILKKELEMAGATAEIV